MKTYSITLNSKQIDELIKKYPDAQKRYDLPYTLYQLLFDDASITLYQSGKAVFQGPGAKHYAQDYLEETNLTLPQGGSDEVGTGSYFGPITVCACLLTDENIKDIPLSMIQDSKQIQDRDIYVLAPVLMEKIPHSLLILSNQKYNDLHQTMNINEIKAKLHNQAYLNLYQKTSFQSYNIIDQFTAESNYYRYLNSESKVFKDLHFETKAESKYPAVACASIIARYAFLKQLEAMSQHYQFDFPSGAGAKVDEAGQEFVRLYGADALNKVAKLHFANSKRILSL